MSFNMIPLVCKPPDPFISTLVVVTLVVALVVVVPVPDVEQKFEDTALEYKK